MTEGEGAIFLVAVGVVGLLVIIMILGMGLYALIDKIQGKKK